MPSVRLGTCSWKYPSWKGLVYSRATGIDYLAEYARAFPSVEIDQWFWAPPEPGTVAEYLAAVPADFRFTIKVPNAVTLTHFYKKKGETSPRSNPDFLSVPLFSEVLSRLEPLKERTGALMLQFEYLNRQKMASPQELMKRLDSFVAEARSAGAQGWPITVEIRNPAWLDAAWFRFLAERDIGHVFLQGYYMPPITSLYERHGGLLKGTTVVRLHGPDRQGMEKLSGEKWDRVLAPKDGELTGIAGMIADMAFHGLTVYVNVNNHYEGSAPLTIGKIRPLLEAQGVDLGTWGRGS
jgi:uncharacterized protein YecE (DUF72 family)